MAFFVLQIICAEHFKLIKLKIGKFLYIAIFVFDKFTLNLLNLLLKFTEFCLLYDVQIFIILSNTNIFKLVNDI